MQVLNDPLPTHPPIWQKSGSGRRSSSPIEMAGPPFCFGSVLGGGGLEDMGVGVVLGEYLSAIRVQSSNILAGSNIVTKLE